MPSSLEHACPVEFESHPIAHWVDHLMLGGTKCYEWYNGYPISEIYWLNHSLNTQTGGSFSTDLLLMEEILQPKLKWRIYQKIYMGFIHLSWLAGFLPSTVSWLRFSSYSCGNSADDTWPARTNTCDGPIDDIRKHPWRLYHQRWNPTCSKSKASKMPKCNKNKRKKIRNISETSKIERKYVFSSPIIKGNHFYSFGRTVWEK